SSSFIEDISCTKDYDKNYEARRTDRTDKQKNYTNKKMKGDTQSKKSSVFKRLGPHFKNSTESEKNLPEKNINENTSNSVNELKLKNRKKSEKGKKQNDGNIKTSETN
ncbi:unnamed protein product, partial [Meganyctiphanes norvegica]